MQSTSEEKIGRNVICDLLGSTNPEQIVVLGGHLDSWDVGQGAHDDAQGCIVAWESVRVLSQLSMRPSRTLRVVCWVDEEQGGRGAKHYHQSLTQQQLEDHVVAIESDMGCSHAIGFGFSGSPEAKQLLQSLLTLLKPIGSDTVVGDGRGVDITPLIESGVPGLLLRFDAAWWDRDYFHFHHSAADTVDKIDPKHLIQNIQTIAATIYMIADLPFRLPR